MVDHKQLAITPPPTTRHKAGPKGEYQHLTLLQAVVGSAVSDLLTSVNGNKKSPALARPFVAEKEGFEPSVPVRVHCFSRAAPSTTRSSLQIYRLLYDYGRNFDKSIK